MLISLPTFTCLNTDRLSKAKIKSIVAEKRAVISWPNPGFPAKWNLMLIPRLRVLTSQQYRISAGRNNSHVISRKTEWRIVSILNQFPFFFYFFIWLYFIFTYYLLIIYLIICKLNSILFFFLFYQYIHSLVYFSRSYSDGHLFVGPKVLCKCRCRCDEMSAFFHATAQCPI